MFLITSQDELEVIGCICIKVVSDNLAIADRKVCEVSVLALVVGDLDDYRFSVGEINANGRHDD